MSNYLVSVSSRAGPKKRPVIAIACLELSHSFRHWYFVIRHCCHARLFAGYLISDPAFLNHVFQQIRHPVAVTPLIVVPTYQLEKTFVEFDPRTFVED